MGCSFDRDSNDLLLRRSKENVNRIHKKWCAQGDDSRTFLGDFVAALSQIVFPAELNL